jgi:membrane protein YdbS with pleckstrin-like domain
MFFLAPSLPHRCKSCDCRYRSNAVWEWIADFIFALPAGIVILLAWWHHLSWPIALVLVLSIVTVMYVIFPFITPFVLVGNKQTHENKPSA